jgi:UDPglucose 6-dehydrogenase
MNITVIGTGYVGLVSGVCLSEIGHNITCLDTNKKVIEKLSKGKVPYYEPLLSKMIKENTKKAKLNFSTSYQKATKDVNIFFICVGTPEKRDGSANLEYVFSVAKSLATYISSDSVIFIKSTVPIGTNDLIQEEINKHKKKGIKIEIASNPEFLKEGDAVNDFMKPDRIIIGTSNKEIEKLAHKIYKPLLSKVSLLITMPIKAAELTKYAANSFLATKISFINEIALLSERLDIDIDDIKVGIGSDPRIGNKFLNAGIGFGGSCFPKDVSSLIDMYKKNKINSYLLSSVKAVNLNQKNNFINKIKLHFKNSDFKDKTFMIWGLSFKPETDDVRESVGIKLVKDLSKKVKKLYLYDPIAMQNAKQELNKLTNIEFIKNQYTKINDCDALILCTEWKSFANPNIKMLKKLKGQVIFDGRNCLNKDNFVKNNIKYVGIGK